MSEETTKKVTSPYLVPGAIIVAGLCVSFAIFATKTAPQEEQQKTTKTEDVAEVQTDTLAITERDHILGAENPDVYLIEYSDYRCGYCGLFHATILELLDEYEGKLAWVYRHTPYQPGGKEAAVASECIAEQLGNDAFWSYTNAAFEDQQNVSVTWSKNKALELGVDEATYDECMASGKYDSLLNEQTLSSQELGGRGTPYNVLLTRKNDIIKFSGAQPIDSVRMFIDRALSVLEN